VGRWYTEKGLDDLEYQLLKYRQRDGWTHRDLLRLAHPMPPDDQYKALLDWVVSGKVAEGFARIQGYESLKTIKPAEAAGVIRELRLPREALPTELLNSAEVWDALIPDMPLSALIRNLGNLSKVGLVTVGSDASDKVVKELRNVERLKNARIHPIAILAALTTYARGRGVRGSGEWIPVPAVVDALNDALYSALAISTSTGKRMLLGIDVSGSMAGMRVNGLPTVTCREAAGVMALASLAAEEKVTTVAFDTKPYPLALSRKQRLDEVVRVLSQTGGGGTDCAAPILFATAKKIAVDAFVIYTDSETWYGSVHPAQAVQEYRKRMGIRAKLVVVAMASNNYSVGDVTDGGTLNVVGLDSSVPDVITSFIAS
jgi:60 kDa SS-A/Ro ribonucleoprotein